MPWYKPKIFNYIDKKGRPNFGIFLSCFVGALCFLVASGEASTIFDWLIAVSGLSSLFTWGSICLCHIRFRQGLRRKSRYLSKLPFDAQLGIYGSYYSFALILLVLVEQLRVALYPIDKSPSPSTFFQSYLGSPVVLLVYVSHKAYKKNWRLFIRTEDIDIDTGRREIDLTILKKRSCGSGTIYL